MADDKLVTFTKEELERLCTECYQPSPCQTCSAGNECTGCSKRLEWRAKMEQFVSVDTFTIITQFHDVQRAFSNAKRAISSYNAIMSELANYPGVVDILRRQSKLCSEVDVAVVDNMATGKELN